MRVLYERGEDKVVYKGGEFAQISSSRKTCVFTSIRDHYAGWDPEKFTSATNYAFCICSKDSKRRTNFAFFTKGGEPVDIDLDFPCEILWIDENKTSQSQPLK